MDRSLQVYNHCTLSSFVLPVQLRLEFLWAQMKTPSAILLHWNALWVRLRIYQSMHANLSEEVKVWWLYRSLCVCAGLCFKLFYVRPVKTSGKVKKGETLGAMLPMQSVYPGITSHVHVQMCNKADPTGYFWGANSLQPVDLRVLNTQTHTLINCWICHVVVSCLWNLTHIWV